MNARLPVAIIGGLITILGITGSVYAQGEPVKPYVFLVVDTSGLNVHQLSAKVRDAMGGRASAARLRIAPVVPMPASATSSSSVVAGSGTTCTIPTCTGELPPVG